MNLINRLFLKHRRLSPLEQASLYLAIILAGVGLFLGWRLFWFLTDDAFIAFRYISNSMRGLGYTWNGPPFRPVEGYTSFLWVVLLEAIWRLSGQEPPVTANIVSFCFAAGTMGIGIMMLGRLPLRESLDRIRLPLLFLVLIAVLTNRTFLTWSSSGLETAMFNFWVMAWLFCALFLRVHKPKWLLSMALTAAAATLTRPDGLLLTAATLLLSIMTVVPLVYSKKTYLWHLLALSPFWLVVAHFVWRKIKYGEWLPNTFAAKYIGIWPESGWRYFLSFTIEYALWFWLFLAILFLLKGYQSPKRLWLQLRQQLVPPSYPLIITAVCLTLVAHFAYYTFVIGGDHFEYRVYSHLIWPIFISAVWWLNQLGASARQTLTFLALFILFALPVQWIHWQATQAYQSREETFGLHVAVADRFPSPMRPYVALFDQTQLWLIEHAVGVRHQEHKIFYEYQTRIFPPRHVGEALAAGEYPVAAHGTVGVPAWVLPDVNIIDVWGLNDYVIARNPLTATDERVMAHSRYAPEGYVACFKPNVNVISRQKIVVVQRELTADIITACENQVWPSGRGSTFPADLGINHQAAPVFDDYLWQVWPTHTQFLYYVQPGNDTLLLNRELAQEFTYYEGAGCVVTRPLAQLSEKGGEIFAFFTADTTLFSHELRDLFSWADFLEESDKLAVPYHLAYMSTAGSEIVAQPDYQSDAVWENGLQLMGYDLLKNRYEPEETINLTLYYLVEQQIPSTDSFFVHLRGDAYNAATGGPLWGQVDGNPCGEQYPLDWIEPGSLLVAKAIILIPGNAPDDDYWLTAGLYNWQSGERLGFTGGDNWENSLRLNQVMIESP
jgi:arabinofuranosyltransferase